MDIVKIAAIDIGSNALRLLIYNVIETEDGPVFKKSSLVRVPIRLGGDAFTHHRITDESVERLIHAMQGFSHLMKASGVSAFKGCATSAMREAANGDDIIKRIKTEADIDINIINGQEEAEIIYSTQIAEELSANKAYLYVDVGGGSTEVTLFSGGKTVDSHSFNIGTIRILQDKVTNADWRFMETWLSEATEGQKSLSLIGSGGNINKLFKMSMKQIGKPLSLSYLRSMRNFLDSFSLDDRVKVLGLNPDRADVIIPATDIFIRIMECAQAKKIHVPKIGLSDGMIRQIYSRYKKKAAPATEAAN